MKHATSRFKPITHQLSVLWRENVRLPPACGDASVRSKVRKRSALGRDRARCHVTSAHPTKIRGPELRCEDATWPYPSSCALSASLPLPGHTRFDGINEQNVRCSNATHLNLCELQTAQRQEPEASDCFWLQSLTYENVTALAWHEYGRKINAAPLKWSGVKYKQLVATRSVSGDAKCVSEQTAPTM